MPPRSTSVGATNVPRAHSARQRHLDHAAARRRACVATCAASASRASASITGPTSIASRRGSPTTSSRIAPSSIASTSGRDVVLNAEDAQRRAALAGAVERGGERIGDDLLGERRAVDDHRVLAAGLGDQHRIVVALRELPRDAARDVGRAGEDHAGDARIGDERRADGLAAPGQELQRRARERPRDAGGEPPRAAISGVCSAGFASTGLPAASAALTSPDEDRQRKIPRRNARRSGRWARRRAPRARARACAA